MFEFRIYRASEMYRNTAPCPEAYQAEGCDDWYISFQDMSELMSFIHREGQIILDNDSLWIYDDYME